MDTTAGSILKLLGKIHLYTGLFISPFVLIYAITAIMFNHKVGADSKAEVTGLDQGLPVVVESSLDKLPLARDIMRQLGLHGEMDNIWRNDKTLSVPVSRPGEIDIIQVDLEKSTASVEHRKTGFISTLLYLHNRPGPHVIAIRGKWFWIKVWLLLADITVYSLLALTVSGPAVWLGAKKNNRTGLIIAVAGLAVTAVLLIIITG